jgi:ribosomal protein S18 acetylase RimI-like enzyme
LIRRLAPGDEPRLQELCRRFKERVPSDEEAVAVLARENLPVWVAEVDGELAGFAYAHVLLRIDGDTSVFLYELDVDERFRRRGLGRALVEQARALGVELGAKEMWVETSYDNDPARRTYEAAGGTAVDEPVLTLEWDFRA